MLSYPSDEVGNHLFCAEKIIESGVNPYTDVLDIANTENCLDMSYTHLQVLIM